MIYAIKHVAEILSRFLLEMTPQSSFLVIKVVANIRTLPAPRVQTFIDSRRVTKPAEQCPNRLPENALQILPKTRRFSELILDWP
jgi:hypothetical protein